MKILIACDMEGLPGVVSWDHVSTDHPEYTRYQKIMTVIVKRAVAHAGAECLPLAEAYQRITAAAQRAITHLKAGNTSKPYRLSDPFTLTVELSGVERADQAQILTGARRLDSRRVEFVAEDALLAYRAFQTIASLTR